MIAIRTATAVTVWMALCALPACGPHSSPKPSPQSPQPQQISPTPAVSKAPAAGPENAFLTVDQVNAIVTKANPDATKVTGPEQITHQPDTPYNGLAAPCNQVLPLYFAAGEPRFSSYAKWTAAGQGNTFVNQLVAEYANAAQANTRFAELAKDIPACANAAGVNRDDGLVLTVGEITPNSVQFQQRATGTNRQLANSHVTSTEYRLVGNSIIAVSATEPAAVVTTIADQLGNRLGG